MHIYLIRHGQSFVNLETWLAENGDHDAGLTDLGRQQAAAVATEMVSQLPDVDNIHTSPLLRARETTQEIVAAYAEAGRHPRLEVHDKLREFGQNQLDHRPWPAHMKEMNYAEFWGNEQPWTPVLRDRSEAETWMHFRLRVGLYVEEIVQAYATADRGEPVTLLSISHGGVIEAVIHHIFNSGHFTNVETMTQNTGITHIEYLATPGHRTWRLHSYNRIPHLADIS